MLLGSVALCGSSLKCSPWKNYFLELLGEFSIFLSLLEGTSINIYKQQDYVSQVLSSILYTVGLKTFETVMECSIQHTVQFYASWKALLHKKNSNTENKPGVPLTESLQLTRHNGKHTLLSC